MGRIGCRAGLVLAALTVAAVLLPAAPAAAAELCAPSAAVGQVRVAIVVDYGTEPGSPGSASVRCLTVPAGTTGGQLLKQRAELLGQPLPRYDSGGGLLCAIDGFPGGSECGAASGDEFRYWSYWSGTSGSWVYGQGNPFIRRLSDGDIEGWRFVSAAESAAPAPRVAPSTNLFPAPPAPTPAPVPALPSVDSPGAAPAAPGVAPGAESGSTTTVAPVPSAEGAGATSTTSTPSTTERAAGGSSPDADEPPPIGEIAIAPTADSSGPPVATLAGALLVAGMVVAGGLRLRRSS